MAINETAMSRRITLPTTNVSAGNGFNQLAAATSDLSKVISDRFTDVAIEQAALQGERDVQNNEQPNTLAFGLTRATRAYNKAVSETEARRMVESADEMIQESLINAKNPATFSRDTPAQFKATLDGIKSGILQNARDENREHIREAIDRLSAHASLDMLNHSIRYENARVKFDMEKDISGLLEARRNAAVDGDAERLAGIDAELEQSVSNYSAMSNELRINEPFLRKKIEQQKQIDSVLGGYANALSNGNTAHYLQELSENKQNLPFNVWQDAVKGVVALDQAHKRLSNDFNAEQVAQIKAGIENGSISSPTELLNYDITIPQFLAAQSELQKFQAKQMAENSTLITAQQNILNGHPQFNSGATLNKMFTTQIQNLEQTTGAPASLQDMEYSILGLNDFPASGMPKTPIGTNVPAFDAVIQGKLTSKDVASTAQAAMIYNDMVNTRGQPNSINLTSDALAVATLFNHLNNGNTTPEQAAEQAAEQAINTVLNANEPEIQARSDVFHRTLEHINPKTGRNELMIQYKEIFGTDPQAFGSNQSFKLFSDIYRSMFLYSNSKESALEATKYEMRAFGQSKYFDNGFVGQPVPEKELPITQIGHAFDNQIIWNLQGLINRNDKARAEHPELKIPKIEWAYPKQAVNPAITEQQKVFDKLTMGDAPRIKIDGFETDVKLIPSATSRLGNRISYILGAYDQFNNFHPIKDITNTTDGVARFMPQGIDAWAPSIATEKSDEAIKQTALNILHKEQEEKVRKLEKDKFSFMKVFSLERSDMFLQRLLPNPEESNRLDKIIQSIKGGSALKTREEITKADNIGISMNLEPTK